MCICKSVIYVCVRLYVYTHVHCQDFNFLCFKICLLTICLKGRLRKLPEETINVLSYLTDNNSQLSELLTDMQREINIAKPSEHTTHFEGVGWVAAVWQQRSAVLLQYRSSGFKLPDRDLSKKFSKNFLEDVWGWEWIEPALPAPRYSQGGTQRIGSHPGTLKISGILFLTSISRGF